MKKIFNKLFIRKSIHLITGILVFGLTFALAREILLWIIVAGTLFSFLTFHCGKLHILHKTSDASLGTLFYPLGILSSYLMLYKMPILYFQTSLMVLTISDTIANIVGQIKNGNKWFRVLHDWKSIHGMMGYVFSALIIFYVFLPLSLTNNTSFMSTLILASLVFELISWRGSDNFTIPFGLALFFGITHRWHLNFVYFTFIMLFMIAGSYLFFKWNVLTRIGALAAWLIGVYLIGVMGWKWIEPVLIFFISSVLFTKLHDVVIKKRKKSNARNAWQVTANILWAVISSALFLLTQNELFIYLFIAFVAAVTADTWASEIGPVFNSRSFSLSDFQMHEAGITGGISFIGTMAALAGAFCISAVSYYLFFWKLNWNMILILSLSAFLACFADTLLGTFLEGKLMNMSYFRKDMHPESITPNDIVNLGGSFTAFAFFLLLGQVL